MKIMKKMLFGLCIGGFLISSAQIYSIPFFSKKAIRSHIASGAKNIVKRIFGEMWENKLFFAGALSGFINHFYGNYKTQIASHIVWMFFAQRHNNYINELKEIKSELTKVNDKLADIKTTVNNQPTKQDLDNAKKELSALVTDLQSKTGEEIKDLNEEIKKLNEEITSKLEAIEKQGERIRRTQVRHARQMTGIYKKLEKNEKKAQARHTEAQNRLLGVEADLGSVTKNLVSQGTKLTEITKQLKNCATKDDVTQLQHNLGQIKNEFIAICEAMPEQLQQQFKKQLSDLEQRISQLETTINGIMAKFNKRIDSVEKNLGDQLQEIRSQQAKTDETTQDTNRLLRTLVGSGKQPLLWDKPSDNPYFQGSDIPMTFFGRHTFVYIPPQFLKKSYQRSSSSTPPLLTDGTQ